MSDSIHRLLKALSYMLLLMMVAAVGYAAFISHANWREIPV